MSDQKQPRKRDAEADLADIKRKAIRQVPDAALEMLRLARKERAMRQRKQQQHPTGIFTGWGEHAQ